MLVGLCIASIAMVACSSNGIPTAPSASAVAATTPGVLSDTHVQHLPTSGPIFSPRPEPTANPAPAPPPADETIPTPEGEPLPPPALPAPPNQCPAGTVPILHADGSVTCGTLPTQECPSGTRPVLHPDGRVTCER
jgi:hypothetical protein